MVNGGGHFDMLVGSGAWAGRPRSRSLCMFFCESGCERNSRNLDIVDGGGPSVIWLMEGRGRSRSLCMFFL